MVLKPMYLECASVICGSSGVGSELCGASPSLNGRALFHVASVPPSILVENEFGHVASWAILVLAIAISLAFGYLHLGRFRYWLCMSCGTLDIYILGEVEYYLCVSRGSFILDALFCVGCKRENRAVDGTPPPSLRTQRKGLQKGKGARCVLWSKIAVLRAKSDEEC